ncbi:mitotic spindle assembly checkpoint protein MAD1 [Vigna unguiculata]|uniref:Mitotic spindle assembly checkpoint protein MAD1 n=1 Tax=Vigna unguiculata TaxID=3917 RepID=A0A4D6KWG9_VIGUN|nr:mitotic spindle assembly checkpoint protein MAD1 [Vigna unguiculata]
MYYESLMVKSDFIEALNKAENQARDYQSKFETLEDNFQKVGQYMLVEVAFHLIFSFLNLLVKSDFIEALNKAENQARDYQSKFETLEDNFQKVESERKKFVDQFLYAEQELAAAKGREQALQEQLLKEVTESQERLRKQIQLNSELQLEQMECRANNAEREAELLKEQLKHLKGQLDEDY